MFKKLALTLLVLTIALISYAAILPADLFVFREVVISAPPAKIFPHLNNSKLANDWMPWDDSDPEVQMVYSGPEEGVGSKSSWESSGEMGTGEALIIESVLDKSVKTQLTYQKPFQMSQVAELSLVPEGQGTKVVWSVSGQKNLFFRVLGIFFNCDTMIGGEFEKGLTNLKRKVESM